MIYVLKAIGTSYFKIGVANDVQNRMSSIQSGSPFPLTLEYRAELTSRTAEEKMEKKLHQSLNEYRTYGEWFKFPPDFKLSQRIEQIIQTPLLVGKPKIEVAEPPPIELFEPPKKIERAAFVCASCGYQWKPRTQQKPKKCPYCFTRGWEK